MVPGFGRLFSQIYHKFAKFDTLFKKISQLYSKCHPNQNLWNCAKFWQNPIWTKFCIDLLPLVKFDELALKFATSTKRCRSLENLISQNLEWRRDNLVELERLLQIEPLIAKIGVDTHENGPQTGPNIGTIFRSPTMVVIAAPYARRLSVRTTWSLCAVIFSIHSSSGSATSLMCPACVSHR